MQQDSSPEISPSVVPEEARPSNGGWLIFLDPAAWLVFGLALGLDQLTKWLVTSNMARSQSIPEEGFFRITYVWNTGSAFGLFTGQGEILTVVSLAAVALLLFFYRHAGQESLIVRLAIGLQLGGAVGNIVDRFRLGHVTDFIDVGPWPIFNLADSSIVVGITIMVVYFLYTRERYVPPPAEPAANHQQPGQISPPAEGAGDPSGPQIGGRTYGRRPWLKTDQPARKSPGRNTIPSNPSGSTWQLPICWTALAGLPPGA